MNRRDFLTVGAAAAASAVAAVLPDSIRAEPTAMANAADACRFAEALARVATVQDGAIVISDPPSRRPMPRSEQA